jgi:hypothetical protein
MNHDLNQREIKRNHYICGENSTGFPCPKCPKHVTLTEKAADFRAQSAASFFSWPFPFPLGFLLPLLSLRLSVT